MKTYQYYVIFVCTYTSCFLSNNINRYFRLYGMHFSSSKFDLSLKNCMFECPQIALKNALTKF